MTEGLVSGKKYTALLLDPDKTAGRDLQNLLRIAEECRVNYIFAGGSITYRQIDPFLEFIRENSSVPIVLFPGNLLQLSLKTDFILFLSLISGRNPELLIGNHVIAAPWLREIKEKVIPTGYILINCGSRTAVEYMSQTEAIPSEKTDIIVATALAGEMLGLKMIYLEGGSGADHPIPKSAIKEVKNNISVPLVVGGGIRSAANANDAFEAGADMIVIGNGCEKRPELIKEVCAVRDFFSQ
jgi:putative glycerol-1-phosphate prenyltransferase